MKPIHKYNNGNGAMLCNGCRTIISTGPKTEEVLCEKCKEECEKIAEDYAIDFAEWVNINYFVYNTWEESKSIKQLLEIFKKEKGL